MVPLFVPGSDARGAHSYHSNTVVRLLGGKVKHGRSLGHATDAKNLASDRPSAFGSSIVGKVLRTLRSSYSSDNPLRRHVIMTVVVTPATAMPGRTISPDFSSPKRVSWRT